MNYDEYVRYLVAQPLGTVVIVDGYVFSKTLDMGRALGWDAKADRWYCPTARLYYDGIEMVSAALLYEQTNEKLVVIG